MKTRGALLSLLFVFSLPLVLAKSESNLTMLWPPGKPDLKLIFEKFRQVGNFAGQNTYVSDVTVQNLTEKKILRAFFTVYLMDKSNVRIGEGFLQFLTWRQRSPQRSSFSSIRLEFPCTLRFRPKRTCWWM
jgi:hypothetical protein